MGARSTSKIFVWAALALTLGAVGACQAAPGGAAKTAASPNVAGVAGNLAVIDLRVHEIVTGGAPPRLVIQALIENQTPINRTGPYEVRIRAKETRRTLGECRGEALPQGQVAVCEVWLANEPVRQGDVFEASLNRDVADFDKWDADPSDDRRTFQVRTVSEGNQVLRLASFEVVPQQFQGASDVRFRFQVEGAHLAWLLSEDRAPRLLAGHPADGLLTGKGTERIAASGPMTLVARNSFGSFVYETIPVFNTYQAPEKGWTQVPAREVDGKATVTILDPGVYDVDEDQAILGKLRSYLAAKDWAQVLEKLRAAPADNETPRPAGVLNPGPRPAPTPATGTKRKKQ